MSSVLFFDEFQRFVVSKWFGSRDPKDMLIVASLGIGGEAGEFQEKMKKHFRGDSIDFNLAAMELSDVLFYLTILADCLGYDLEDIAKMQMNKINGRIERGTRRGSGDDR